MKTLKIQLRLVIDEFNDNIICHVILLSLKVLSWYCWPPCHLFFQDVRTSGEFPFSWTIPVTVMSCSRFLRLHYPDPKIYLHMGRERILNCPKTGHGAKVVIQVGRESIHGFLKIPVTINWRRSGRWSWESRLMVGKNGTGLTHLIFFSN